MCKWKTRVHVTEDTLKVWVRTSTDEELVRARLPMRPSDRRALTAVLQGLALWAGPPLHVVISAVGQLDDSLVSDLFDAALWPAEDPLLRLSFAERPGHPRRADGGDARFAPSTTSTQRGTR